MMMMMMMIHTITKNCGRVFMQLGHWAARKCVSRLDVGSRWTWCTLWWHSSTIGKPEQTRTPLCLACTAETGNPAFGCEMTDYILEQSADMWGLHLRVALRSTGLGSSAHEQFTWVQFMNNSFWIASKSNAFNDSLQVLTLIFNFFYQIPQDCAFLLLFFFFFLHAKSHHHPLSPVAQNIPIGLVLSCPYQWSRGCGWYLQFCNSFKRKERKSGRRDQT